MLALIVAAMTLWPSQLSGIAAPIHVAYAISAAHEFDVEPELLLAIAAVESNFTPTVISVSGDHCGVLQASTKYSGMPCTELLGLHGGYRGGAKLLRQWIGHARGDVRRALRGFGCGWAAMSGTCSNAYDLRVLARRAKLGRLLAGSRS